MVTLSLLQFVLPVTVSTAIGGKDGRA